MSENSKQIASFIALTVAISAPMAIAQETYTENLMADASVMINHDTVTVSPVMRYAGPEYFGFGPTTIREVTTPVVLPKADIPPVQDTAQYMQVQSNILNNTNASTQINTKADVNTVNINNVQTNSNFINTEYGSVKVLDAGGHFIFK